MKNWSGGCLWPGVLFIFWVDTPNLQHSLRYLISKNPSSCKSPEVQFYGSQKMVPPSSLVSNGGGKCLCSLWTGCSSKSNQTKKPDWRDSCNPRLIVVTQDKENLDQIWLGYLKSLVCDHSLSYLNDLIAKSLPYVLEKPPKAVFINYIYTLPFFLHGIQSGILKVLPIKYLLSFSNYMK